MARSTDEGGRQDQTASYAVRCRLSGAVLRVASRRPAPSSGSGVLRPVAGHGVHQVLVQRRPDLPLVHGEEHQPLRFDSGKRHAAVLLQQTAGPEQRVVVGRSRLQTVGGVHQRGHTARRPAGVCWLIFSVGVCWLILGGHTAHRPVGDCWLNLWDVRVPAVGAEREQEHKVQRLIGTVAITDFGEVSAVADGSPAEDDVLPRRLLANQDGHLLHALRPVVPARMLARRACLGADDQLQVLDLILGHLARHDKVTHQRVVIPKELLQVLQ